MALIPLEAVFVEERYIRDLFCSRLSTICATRASLPHVEIAQDFQAYVQQFLPYNAEAREDAEIVFGLLNDDGQGVNNAKNTAVGYRLHHAANLFRKIQEVPADMLDVHVAALVDMAERFKSRFSDAQAAFDAKPQETGNYIQDMITKSHHVERLIKAIMDFVTNPLESNARIIHSAQTKQQYDAIRDELVQTLAEASKQTVKATNIIGRYAGVEPVKTERVFLRAFNGLFVSAKFHLKNELMADREEVEGWEIFDLFWLGENKVALRGFKKLFIQANPDQNGALLANGPNIREWETFTIHYLEDGKIALQAFTGLFVSAKLHEQNQLVADREEVEGWETFNLLWV